MPILIIQKLPAARFRTKVIPRLLLPMFPGNNLIRNSRPRLTRETTILPTTTSQGHLPISLKRLTLTQPLIERNNRRKLLRLDHPLLKP